MNRACLYRRWALCAALLCAAPFALTPAPLAAQEGEARLLFERGNQHLAAGMRARGRRRTRELEQALDAYVGVLRLGGRTRNVVFNLALTLQELGREREAFNYYAEYLSSFDLSAEDRAEGERRLEAIRPRVAVLEIATEPAGAAVRIDRRDLPTRGETPLTLAVEPGEHTVILQRAGFEEATAPATATVGQSARVQVALVGRPVAVQFLAPAGGALTLDGAPVPSGQAIGVRPGRHTVRLTVAGAPPVERSFEVQPGAEPMVLELQAAAGAQTRVALAISEEAEVRLDGVLAGHGRAVELPIAPGDHVVHVSAPGFHPATHRFQAAPDERLALSVDLGAEPDRTGLDVARAIVGPLAAVGLAASGVLGLYTLLAHGDYTTALDNFRFSRPGAPTQEELDAQADSLETVLLVDDVVLGATAALGVTALVLLFVDAGGGEPSTVDVALGASPAGASLSVRGAL